MTVSRALSNQPNVQKETREAVLRRAQELGYVRSAAAAAIRGDGTRIVGLLLPNLVNEFYARFADTMAMACERASLHLTIHLTRDDIAAEAVAIRRLQEIQARAVVMVPTPGTPGADQPQTKILTQAQGMGVVHLIRQRATPAPVPTVLVDDDTAIRDAVAHLHAAGHERIAYIGAMPDLSSGQARLAAYRAGAAAAGVPYDPALVHTAEPSADTGRAAMQSILQSGTATAVVCGGFEISNGALITMLNAGKRPGDTFGFVGYGDPSFYNWIGTGVSTVAVPVDELADCAAQILTERTPAPEQHRFAARLIPR